MSVNKVMLIGNLGKDPELRVSASQVQICTFSLATTDRRKDASGTWTDYTEWHNIVVFGTAAENCSKYLKKGRQAFIEGKIQTRKWQDKEGKDRYTTEIIAERVQFLGTKGDSSSSRDESAPAYGSASSYSVETSNSSSQQSNIPMAGLKTADQVGNSASGEVSFDDDDIPF